MAETSGLLNRRTGNSRTEGSNPSVSASNPSFRCTNIGESPLGRACTSILPPTDPLTGKVCKEVQMREQLSSGKRFEMRPRGVFQASRAEIAREMKCRLDLKPVAATSRAQVRDSGSR